MVGIDERDQKQIQQLEGGLSGCGEEVGACRMGGAEPDAAVARTSKTLLRNERLDGEGVDELLSEHSRSRRNLLRAGGLFGAIAAAGPILAPARAAACEGFGGGADEGGAQPLFSREGGRVHVVESTSETVNWGVFDSTRPNIVDVDSGDVVSFRDTWSHFFNQLEPGLPIEQIVALRLAHPGVGPHSIVGPIGVLGAQPGDMLEVQYLRLHTDDFGACFNNPGYVGTGALPDVFVDGQVKYFDLDQRSQTAEFAPGITLPMTPFQGTCGVAPADGVYAPPPGRAVGVVSSVPPGQHAGNMDCRLAVEGSRLFVPVWKDGAKLFTGDSHALQGDGEVNLCAMETRMREVRVRLVLHKQVGWTWPMHETPSAWIVHGTNADLNVAFRTALLNAIAFLTGRAGLTQLDAYALCSLAVSFRVSQVVNGAKGVYGVIPKSIFHPALRRSITVI